jgi:hypothetical protein
MGIALQPPKIKYIHSRFERCGRDLPNALWGREALQSFTGFAASRCMKRTYVVPSFRREQGPSGP